MKKTLLLILSILSISTFAQDFTPTGYVTDLANVFSVSEKEALENKISEYEIKTSIEIAVIVAPKLETYIEDFAYKQYNRIGVGKKGANNGILIVFSIEDKQSRIELGKGMEPFITDFDSYNSLETIKPFFKESKFYEGTDACITSLINTLGTTPYAEKVQWLKKKKEKEALESEIAYQSFLKYFRYFSFIAIFFGLLGWAVYLDRKSKKVKKGILEAIKDIKEVNVAPISTNSKRLNSLRDTFLDTKKTILEDIKQKSKENNETYLSRLSEYKSKLITKRSSIISHISDVNSKLNKIRLIDSSISQLSQMNVEAIEADDFRMKQGYRSMFTPFDVSNLVDMVKPIKSELDVDSAIIKYSLFDREYATLHNKANVVINSKREILSAIKLLNDSDNKIKNALKPLDNYSGYIKSGELDSIKRTINSFNENKSDILSRAITLTSVILTITNLYNTLRRRKQDEEDAERRRKEAIYAASAAAYSSSSSSSSYSSGSSFRGFGGGSSGGGGASSGW